MNKINLLLLYVLYFVTMNLIGAEEKIGYALISKLADRNLIMEDFSLPPKIIFYQTQVDIVGYFKMIPDYKRQTNKKEVNEDFNNLSKLDGKIFTSYELENNIHIYLKNKNNEDLPVKYYISPESIKLYQRDSFYRFVISTNSLPIGMYQVKFNITIPNYKEVIHLTDNVNMPTNRIVIKKIETENDRELAILMQLSSMKENNDNTKLKEFVDDLLINKKSTIELHRFEVASYLPHIATINGKKSEVLAWTLLSNRLGVRGTDFNLSIIDYGGWENVLKDENKIELISSELKVKYFPDIKYKYSPEELNLSKIYAEKEKLKNVIKGENTQTEKVNDSEFEKKEDKIIGPKIQADIIISLKADGKIYYGSQELKIEEVQAFLKKKIINNENKILVIAQQNCNLSFVQSVLLEIKKIGMGNVEFKLEKEL